MRTPGSIVLWFPTAMLKRRLSDSSWEYSMDDGLPGWIIHFENGTERTVYYRFGDGSGIEPLVFRRDFRGIRESYFELSEEYRHFHNLYHDRRSNHYLRITREGNEEVVAKASAAAVEMRLRDVREFLRIKEMHLAIFFDIVRYSAIDPADIGHNGESTEYRDGFIRYSFGTSPCFYSTDSDHKSFSRLCGKKLVPPLPKTEKGWGSSHGQKKHEDFIIGLDSQGNPILYTSDPKRLANFFGSNPGAPNYLTPVFFRREVLAKYYANPGKYSVEDGYLRCSGLWGLQIDNNHAEYVVVFLGDLGRNLSYSEQLYWKSFNVPPQGKISKANFRRSFLAEPAEPERVDLLFKSVFKTFIEEWRRHFGWDLFMPLSPEDVHFYTALRVPLTNDQAEFDAQVLALTKIFIDSINEKRLSLEIGDVAAEEKAISKLDRYLRKIDVPDAEKYIAFLPDLQALRSSGVAHRKGAKYDEVSDRFGIKEKDLIRVFEEILRQSFDLIDHLRARFK